MARNDLTLRIQAVLCAYKDNNLEQAIDYVMNLYKRNKVKKLYRFQPPKQHEIDAIRDSKIYMCRR